MNSDGPDDPAAAVTPEPVPGDNPIGGGPPPPPVVRSASLPVAQPVAQPVAPPVAPSVNPPVSRRGWDRVSIAALVLAVPGVVIAAIPLAIVGFTRTRNGVRRGRALAVAGLALSWAWTLVLA
jgi:hypothetical protein